MSVRMRHTRAHTKNRRAHHKLSAPRLSKDSETGALHLRHHVDMATGMYRGKKIFEPSNKVARKIKNAVAKLPARVQPHMHDRDTDMKVKKQATPRARAQRRTATSASKGG